MFTGIIQATGEIVSLENRGMAFNSDAPEFGGFSRLGSDERHCTVDGKLSLYLPSRVAIVLKKIK